MSTEQHSGFNTINCGSEKSHGKEREKENEKEWKKETEKEGGREEEGRESNAEKLLILYPFLSL